MSKVTDILDMVKEMTVLELSELVKAFEEEFCLLYTSGYYL